MKKQAKNIDTISAEIKITQKNIDSYRNKPNEHKSKFVLFVLDHTTIEEYVLFKREYSKKYPASITPLMDFCDEFFDVALKRYTEKISQYEKIY